MLYRGLDGHVNSLNWSTGDVGFDHLTSSIGAPKAAGNPVGYFEAAANINHVIYRGVDGHLHELWWTAQQPVSHGDITQQAGASDATVTPSALLDTARGEHIVTYRATDGHIHSGYWSTGPIGHENLSGFARAPRATGDPHGYDSAHNDTKQISTVVSTGTSTSCGGQGREPGQARRFDRRDRCAAGGTDPVSFYSEQTQTKHVVYHAVNGHLIELWWFVGGTPAYVDLSVEALAPPAAERPSAFAHGPYRHAVLSRHG